jgi:hypothetical protein
VAGSRAVSDPCAHADGGTHTSGESRVRGYAFANPASGHSDTHPGSNRDPTRTYRRAAHAYHCCHLDQLADAVAKPYADQSRYLHELADVVAKPYAYQSPHLHELADAVTKRYADLDTDWCTRSDPPTHCYRDGRGRYAYRRER